MTKPIESFNRFMKKCPWIALIAASLFFLVRLNARLVERINIQKITMNADGFLKEIIQMPEMKCVRFRTLGCYPLTAAVESSAATLGQIVEELRQSKMSERAGRLIDHDQAGSMEQKKREGYF